MTIKHYDAQTWLKEKEARRLKLPAFFFALFGTVLTCLLTGGLVGVFFRHIFWYCSIGIAVISLPYILMDRVQVRLYHGYVKGKPFRSLIKYAFSSTDYRPCYLPCWYWRWYYWW
jgi:hypothetical protein